MSQQRLISQKNSEQKKLLFRAQLDQINMNLMFKFDPISSQSSIGKNQMKFGNITVELEEELDEKSDKIEFVDQILKIKQREHPEKQRQCQEWSREEGKKYKGIGGMGRYSQQEEKQQIGERQEKLRMRMKENLLFVSSQSDQFFYCATQNEVNQQENRYDQDEKKNRKQKQRKNKQEQKTCIGKSEKIFKKLDLSFLLQNSQENDDKQILKCQLQHQEKKKTKVERNRRIGVYIKGLLKNTTAQSININQLLFSVLKNYKNELRCIQDENKRLKTLECLKRRIYQCLSVLSAVGLLEKQKKYVCPTEKITTEFYKSKEEKEKLKTEIEKKELRTKFLKQKYFDALTRKRVFQGLYSRNNISSKNKNIQKIFLPIKLVVGYRPGMTLLSKKQRDSSKINSVVISSKKDIKPIHSIETFILLRRVLDEQKTSNSSQITEYIESISREDKFDRVKKLREKLHEKLEKKEVEKNQFCHLERKSKKQVKRLKKQEKKLFND